MKNGFTLMELLIVIGIIVLLSIILLPIGFNYYQRELLNKTEDQLVWLLKEARDNAVNQKNGSFFGVYIAVNDFIIFQGPNYNQRAAENDSSYSFPETITISGLKEIIFVPNTGTTQQVGTISLALGQFKKDISINEFGIINY
jgi:prepilin-type N-terminal cleavage/methylation domain-containing protein